MNVDLRVDRWWIVRSKDALDVPRVNEMKGERKIVVRGWWFEYHINQMIWHLETYRVDERQ